MKKNTTITAYLSLSAMLLLILNTKNSIIGASDAIDLCLKTLIPTLFPFLVISSLCHDSLLGRSPAFLKRLLAPCQLPVGAESVFLISLLGGYPIGAKLISEAYTNKDISRKDAERMTMFCNNAGPSFIFGVLGQFYQRKWIPWMIWFIHILSAYIVGVITARQPDPSRALSSKVQRNITKTVTNATKTMVGICAWVVLFRVLLAYLDPGPLSHLPPFWNTLLTGILELANGCIKLNQIERESLRFMAGLLIITFGGICVTMQSTSIMGQLTTPKYFLGKLMQCTIATLLSLPVQHFLLTQT